MTSIKIKTNWETNNIVSNGVRIYKKTELFDSDNLPQPLVEITDGSEFYEDLDIIEGQTYFYMLSCFLGEQEVFTECFKVDAKKPSPYNGIYIVGSTNSYDTDAVSRLSEIISEIGEDVYVKTWEEMDSIPADAKLIYAPSLDYTHASTSAGVTKLVAKFNAGIPVLISTYSNTIPTMPNLGIGANFSDSSGSSVDIMANTILSPPFNTAQSGLVIRESSYYMSAVTSLTPNAHIFAMRGSSVVGAILQAGIINRNNIPSPANVAFAGFSNTRTGRILNDTGKDLLREIVKKTMR